MFLAYRWARVWRLKRVPAVTGVISAIGEVEDTEGISYKAMTVEFTPEVGPDAGKLIRRRERARVFARFETVVGQRIPIHVDPRSSSHVYIPEATQHWVVMGILLLICDLTIALSLLYDALKPTS